MTTQKPIDEGIVREGKEERKEDKALQRLNIVLAFALGFCTATFAIIAIYLFTVITK